MTEIWKDIVGYEGLYQVSNLGRVKSIDRRDRIGVFHGGRFLSTFAIPSGYLYVSLHKNGNKIKCRILFNIECDDINYVIYTEDKKNKSGEIISYASSYVLSEKGNMTKLKPVTNKEEFDFISKILSSLEYKKN